VDLLYSREVDVNIRVSNLRIFTDRANEPFSGADTAEMLNSFTDHWRQVSRTGRGGLRRPPAARTLRGQLSRDRQGRHWRPPAARTLRGQLEAQLNATPPWKKHAAQKWPRHHLCTPSLSQNTGIPRTLAHLLSGKNLGGGRAFLSALCNPQIDTGVTANMGDLLQWDGNQNNNPARVVWDVVAFAHELGHNFGSSHTHEYCRIGGVAQVGANGPPATTLVGQGHDEPQLCQRGGGQLPISTVRGACRARAPPPTRSPHPTPPHPTSTISAG
jgi:hypothetical protein